MAVSVCSRLMVNVIKLYGVSFFLYPFLKYNSKRAITTFILGILYHSTENRKIFLLDLLVNCCMVTYTVARYKRSRIFAFCGTLSWVINQTIYYYIDYDLTLYSFVHVVGSQWILLKGLINSIHEKREIMRIKKNKSH